MSRGDQPPGHTWPDIHTSLEGTWYQRQLQRYPPTPTREQTDTGENITFPQLRLRAVINNKGQNQLSQYSYLYRRASQVYSPIVLLPQYFPNTLTYVLFKYKRMKVVVVLLHITFNENVHCNYQHLPMW